MAERPRLARLLAVLCGHAAFGQTCTKSAHSHAPPRRLAGLAVRAGRAGVAVQKSVQYTVMKAIPYTTVRATLAKTMDRVTENHEPILITRQKGAAAVLMSIEDFEAWRETAYLLRSPRNARRLGRAIAQIEAGKAKPRKLIR